LKKDNDMKLLSLVILSLVLALAMHAQAPTTVSYVIATNPLFGIAVYPDMATAKTFAPVLAEMIAASMPMCAEPYACFGYVHNIQYEVRTVTVPKAEQAPKQR
jgi:hypothetical protein